MRETTLSPPMLVDRLEKKYQKKIRFQKYKTIAKHLRQRLANVQGMQTKDLEDDSFDMFNFNDYEYISR